MNCVDRLRLFVAAFFVSVMMPSVAQAGASYLFDVTNSGLVSTLNVDDITQPVSSYQITGVSSTDIINAASFDPNTNRLYYVNNLTATNQAQLDYVQLNAQGVVLGQTTVGILSPVTASYGADYYDGRVWISQDNTNMVYGYDPNHLGAAPITLTLPTPSGNPSTLFNLGDLTFNDAENKMFIAGSLGGSNPGAFIYEYSLNGFTPTLIASRIYTNTSSDPRFNGLIFNQSTDVLYGFNNTTGHLYTIDTSTLTVASDVGFNQALYQGGDLAGFSANGISVPEPSSIVSLTIGLLIMLACRRLA